MNREMILSLIRSTLISVGTVWAAKKGVDGATVEAVVSGLIAAAAAAWGAWDKRKKA